MTGGGKRIALVALAVTLSTAACGVDDGASSAGNGGHADGGGLPSAHVHGVGVNPADGEVYLASHDGLFRLHELGPGEGDWQLVSPVIDLMGFAIAGPDHFYASGHPGPGVDLPEPVGLIESTDGGSTWQPLSRQGQSDFHTMAVSDSGVLGFDGALRTTSDGVRWEDGDIPADPYSLAADAAGRTVLATTQEGVLRSTDGGSTWSLVQDAPLLQVLDWTADASSVVGVGPQGDVWSSDDGGRTWDRVGQVGAQPQAVAAEDGAADGARVLVVTEDTLLQSTDGGRTFARLA